MSDRQEKQIKVTGDGSHTIYIPELDECYHSIHGARQESYYIFINAGFKNLRKEMVRIFEMGFGAGLNAFLTCIEAIKTETFVDYSGIDLYPLSMSITGKLNYGSLADPEYRALFQKMHSCEWNKPDQISEYFNLLKIRADIRDYEIKGKYDLVYFDAFAPDKQPELWQTGVFTKFYNVLMPQGIFMTYSAKGMVKRNLERSGFRVYKIPGPPGKREIIKACKGEN